MDIEEREKAVFMNSVVLLHHVRGKHPDSSQK